MYAVIKTGGKQYRVAPGDVIEVELLDAKEGDEVALDDVLMFADGDQIKTGTPTIKKASVSGEIVKHGRDKKIIVFKQKRRKNYARKQGHRQKFTEIRIKSISLG